MASALELAPHSSNLKSLLSKTLSGIFAIYKPPDMKIDQLQSKLKKNISQELNGMLRQHKTYFENFQHTTSITNELQLFDMLQREVFTQLNFQTKIYSKDIDLVIIKSPGSLHSGIALVGIFDGVKILEHIETHSKWLEEYELYGHLGESNCELRDNTELPVRLFESKHITTVQISRAVSLMDAKHRFELTHQ
ncbi:MAG: TruB pseudouridylate synthase (N terminal domain), partial [Paramarteilia canceri]